MSDGPNIEASTQDVRISTILKKADKAVEGTDRIKPSDAWEYRETVRRKYDLPECGYLTRDPVGFIHTIEAFLKKHKVKIRPTHEFQPFFEEYPGAGAWTLIQPSTFRENTVVVPQASAENRTELIKRVRHLAHEAVHALQFIRYPTMPLGEFEREAYYYEQFTPLLILTFQDAPELLTNRLEDLEKKIQGSVEIDRKIDPQGRTS